MKKILSVMLIFILSLFVVSTTDLLKAEATEDVGERHADDAQVGEAQRGQQVEVVLPAEEQKAQPQGPVTGRQKGPGQRPWIIFAHAQRNSASSRVHRPSACMP